jgi:hypothetical protein
MSKPTAATKAKLKAFVEACVASPAPHDNKASATVRCATPISWHVSAVLLAIMNVCVFVYVYVLFTFMRV